MLIKAIPTNVRWCDMLNKHAHNTYWAYSTQFEMSIINIPCVCHCYFEVPTQTTCQRDTYSFIAGNFPVKLNKNVRIANRIA